MVELYEKRKTEIEKEANDSLKSLGKMISQSEAARDKKESNLRSVISGLNAEESFQTNHWNPVIHGLLGPWIPGSELSICKLKKAYSIGRSQYSN